jgi:hypothetical protein
LLILGSAFAGWSAPALRWVSDPQAPALASVEATLPAEFAIPGSEAEHREILTVRVAAAPGASPLPSMAGTYEVDGALLRVRPRFPLESGLTYRATLHLLYLPPEGAAAALTAEFAVPPQDPGPRTTVTAITPSAEVLSFNLLKFYLHFSAPMTRGSAYRHIVLRSKDGNPVEDPFLELPEELWDPEMTRLTVLLDPGRIKRGLLPHEIVGAILEEGQDYTLTIDPAWEDAAGQLLESRGEKAFRAGPADYTQPDPKKWRYEYPAAASREALTITFEEPLDAALIARLITIHDASGGEVAGAVATSNAERTWTFLPDRPWESAPYQIHIDHRIEDLAGNSIERRFEEALDKHPEAAGDRPARTMHPFTPRPAPTGGKD